MKKKYEIIKQECVEHLTKDDYLRKRKIYLKKKIEFLQTSLEKLDNMNYNKSIEK
jgi:hypothetical protein